MEKDDISCTSGFEGETKELLRLSRKVADYLQENFHPHTTVVIEVDSIRVDETLAAQVTEYAVD